MDKDEVSEGASTKDEEDWRLGEEVETEGIEEEASGAEVDDEEADDEESRATVDVGGKSLSGTKRL